MSEKRDHRSRDYSKYDSMSAEQLQEVLRLNAHQTDGIEMDTEELFYIMEVVTKRRKCSVETAGKSMQESQADFKKHYAPQEEVKAPIVFPMWLQRATAVAAVLAIFVVITTSVNAFGYDLWDKVATWSQEFFHFTDETQGAECSEPDKQDSFEYTSLQDALDGTGITKKLAPTWLPEGFELVDLLVFDSPREISISAKYSNGDTDIRISIRQLVGSKPEEVEKSEDYILAYDAKGITYYIFENNKLLQAVWVVEEFECFIAGELTLEEIKDIINSI